jgi:hypothetical protein
MHTGMRTFQKAAKCNPKTPQTTQSTLRTSRETKGHPSSIAGALPMSPLFLSVHLSDFSFGMPVRGQSPTFLLLPLIFVHVRTQVIALLDLGQAATTLLSKSQISFVKRASRLCGGEGGMEAKVTSKESGNFTSRCSLVSGESDTTRGRW